MRLTRGSQDAAWRTAGVRLVASALLLGFTSCFPSCTHVRQPQPAPPASLRVMTFNLDKDAASSNDAFRAIAQADPDVICFQEASGPWQAQLRSRLGERYPHASFNAPSNGYDGIGVLSRGTAGRNLNLLVIVIGVVRLMIGGGLF